MSEIETYIRHMILQQADERSVSNLKCLSTRDVKYIITGETGEYTEDTLNERIGEKRDSLDDRLQWLLNDIALLHYQGEIDPAGESWDSILDMAGFVRDLTEKKPTLSLEETNEPETKLGYDIGLVIAMISGFAHDREEILDLIWGLTLAHSATESGQELDERRNLETIFEGLQSRKRDHYKWFIPFEAEEEKKAREKEKDVLEDVLSEFDLSYSDLLSGTVSSHARHHMYENDVSKRQSIRSVVEGFLDNTALEQAQKIRKELSSEWNSLREASAPGVDAEEIVMSVWTEPKRSSEEIASDLYKSRSKGQVTETLNKLAKDGKDRSPSVTAVYEHDPLVEWNDTEQHWVTTDYGDLLCYFRESDDLEWLHDYGLNPENNGLNNRHINQSEWELIQQGAGSLVETI